MIDQQSQEHNPQKRQQLLPALTAQWHAMATRGDYQIGANLTGLGVDEPDANYYENYACGSPRNYSQYCI